jgi:hypothetical protein
MDDWELKELMNAGYFGGNWVDFRGAVFIIRKYQILLGDFAGKPRERRRRLSAGRREKTEREEIKEEK